MAIPWRRARTAILPTILPNPSQTGAHEATGDTLALSILSNVKLAISANWADDEASGVFEITGPPNTLESLLSLVNNDTSLLHGFLSPLSAVTVPMERRRDAGIPTDAASYCYIHPLEHLHDEVESLKLAQQSWAFVLLAGGYAYFDATQRLLQVNAIAYAPSPTGLVLVGHPVDGHAARNAAAMLQKRGRFMPIADESLLSAGFDAYSWVHASEAFDGALVSEEHPYPHGAFLYRRSPAAMESGQAKKTSLRWREARRKIKLSRGGGAEQSLAEASEAFIGAVDQLTSSDNKDGPRDVGGLYLFSLETATQYKKAVAASRKVAAKSPSDVQPSYTLRGAMERRCQQSVAAQRVASEARRLAKLDRKTADAAPVASQLKAYLFRITALLAYIGLGMAFYASVEEDWDATQALYFSVVTISTVGYGDIAPSSTGSRVFTGFYILVGVAVIFGLAGELYVASESAIGGVLRRLLSTAARYVSTGTPSDDAKRGGRREAMQPAWQHYASQLAPTLLAGLGINIFLSAAFFTVTEPGLDYGSALWHCWVTSTTVGYGDVSLTTQASMLWAAAHILISVSWLASLISATQEAYSMRQWEITRFKSMQMQLGYHLFAALETPAARAEGRGINEAEFIVGMLITLGAQVCGQPLDFAAHIQPLIDRFHALDEDKSGQLTREDILFMAESANDALSP